LKRKSTITVLVFLVLSAPLAVCQEILSAESFFDSVSSAFNGIADYSAAVQITSGKSVSTGTIYYKSPFSVRIDFSSPKGQVMVIDAEKLTIYLPDQAVALVQKYRKKAPTEAQALASKQGLAMLRQNYGIAFYSTPGYVPLDDGSKEEVVKLKLTPKSSGAPFSQLVMSVGRDNAIRRMDATLSGGDKFIMDFTGMRTNQNIPDSRFQYDPPPSASVQEDFLFDSSE
jgi:outer membrane lipoprotein-sorting protein